MNDIGFTIIGFAIGYFFAMWRKDNIKCTFINKIDAAEFWRKAEEWRQKEGA